MNVGVKADIADNAKLYTARVIGGNDRGFVGASLSRFNVTAGTADVSANAVSALGGLSFPVGTSSARICPIVQGTYTMGPNYTVSTIKVESSQMSGVAGLSIGGSVRVSDGFHVLPYGGASANYQRISVSANNVSSNETDTNGTVFGGVSLLFNGRFAIQPAINVPVGTKNNDPVYSIGATIGLGKR